MYGFGDDLEPHRKTTELMEQYLIEYISNLCNRVMSRSMRGGHDTLQLADMIHYMKGDPKKYYRIPHNLESSKYISDKKIQDKIKKHLNQ